MPNKIQPTSDEIEHRKTGALKFYEFSDAWN